MSKLRKSHRRARNRWTPPQEFVVIAHRVLREYGHSDWDISALREHRKGRGMAQHSEVVSVCTQIAWELSHRGWSHGAIAIAFDRDPSTIGVWLRKLTRNRRNAGQFIPLPQASYRGAHD